jgi:hypothetical protein
VTWIGGSGNWTNTANWSTGVLPGTNDDVMLEAGPTLTVTHSTGTHVVRSIASDQPFLLSGGSLTVSNTFQTINTLTLSGGFLRVAQVTVTNGASLVVSNSGTLDRVTVNGTLDVGNTHSGANLLVTNGLTLNGTALVGNSGSTANGAITFAGSQTLGGNGTVLFGSQSEAGFNAVRLSLTGTTLTIGPGITIAGQNGTVGNASHWGNQPNVNVINQGVISQNVGGGTIALTPQFFTNKGNVAALAGVVTANASEFSEQSGFLTIGLNSSSSYGKIQFSGSNTLSGPLNVLLVGGFVPSLSNSFNVLTYTSHSGAFSPLNLPPSPVWQVSYGATALTLLITDINKLVFSAQPASTNAGKVVPVVVQVVDSVSGSPVAVSGAQVTVSLNSGTGTLSGTLTRSTDASGKATFNDLSIDLFGPKTLAATAVSAGFTPATSGLFTISYSTPAQLAIVTPFSSLQQNGVTFSPAAKVQVLDQFGNVVSNSTAPITAALASSTGGSLVGTLGANANGIAGTASFSSLGYNLAHATSTESASVYFTSPGLTPVTNPPVLVDFVFPPFALTNGNSELEIDPTNQAGVFSWTVDGAGQLYQKWFWLREGSSSAQQSLDSLGVPFGLSSLSASNATIIYIVQGLQINLGFALAGGNAGSRSARLIENVQIQNVSGSSITAHFFEYSDFDLAGDGSVDTVSFSSSNAVTQVGEGMSVTENIQGVAPKRWEASWYAITLDKLNGSSPLTLSDALLPNAPGDQTFSFEWDSVLAPGQGFSFFATNAIQPSIPAPVALALALSGTNVVVSWPTNVAPSAQLQLTTNLSSGVWLPITNVPSQSGAQYLLTLPRLAPAQFYRLAQ